MGSSAPRTVGFLSLPGRPLVSTRENQEKSFIRRSVESRARLTLGSTAREAAF